MRMSLTNAVRFEDGPTSTNRRTPSSCILRHCLAKAHLARPLRRGELADRRRIAGKRLGRSTGIERHLRRAELDVLVVAQEGDAGRRRRPGVW
jgi:hypothetical protein